MSPLDLATAAAQAMAQPGTPQLVLVLPKGGMPKGFPRGELLNEMERGGRVERTLAFDPSRVLAWLTTNGLVNVQRTPQGIQLSLDEHGETPNQREA